ncbi:MAG: hypothetical protein NT145_01545 [Elusimicrobia bacterium]|nr:hypothetical protein [Elusimicrobiota bacterium]
MKRGINEGGGHEMVRAQSFRSLGGEGSPSPAFSENSDQLAVTRKDKKFSKINVIEANQIRTSFIASLV